MNLPDYPLPIIPRQVMLGLVKSGHIQISSFEESKLAPTSYHLCPWRIRFRDEIAAPDVANTVALNAAEYAVVPGESIVASTRETIILPRGIVGTIYPSSRCIEDGLLLTSGRIESGYRQAVILGLYNASSQSVSLSSVYPLARISFAWMGLEWVPEEDTVSNAIGGGVERTPEEALQS